jgi:hypothetical protein
MNSGEGELSKTCETSPRGGLQWFALVRNQRLEHSLGDLDPAAPACHSGSAMRKKHALQVDIGQSFARSRIQLGSRNTRSLQTNKNNATFTAEKRIETSIPTTGLKGSGLPVNP